MYFKAYFPGGQFLLEDLINPIIPSTHGQGERKGWMLTITEYLLQLTSASRLMQGRYYQPNSTYTENRLRGIRRWAQHVHQAQQTLSHGLISFQSPRLLRVKPARVGGHFTVYNCFSHIRSHLISQSCKKQLRITFPWGRSLGEKGYTRTHGWVPLPFTWHYTTLLISYIPKQNKKLKKKQLLFHYHKTLHACITCLHAVVSDSLWPHGW